MGLHQKAQTSGSHLNFWEVAGSYLNFKISNDRASQEPEGGRALRIYQLAERAADGPLLVRKRTVGAD